MSSADDATKNDDIKNALRIDSDTVSSHLDELVRSTAEDTLNRLLDAEADQLCNAKRYDRSAERSDTRADSYQRKLQTKAGEVELKMPRLRSLAFDTQIIERYKRRGSVGRNVFGRCLCSSC